MRAPYLFASAICLAALPAFAQPKPAPRPAVAAPAPAAPAKPPAPAPAAPVSPSAAAPAAPAPPSDAQRKEAAELTDLQDAQASVTGFLNVVHDRMVALLTNASQKPPEEVAKSVDELLMPDLQSHAVELRVAVTTIWAQHFTLAELKELHAFYMTPLGAKLIREQPQIAQQTQAFGRDWAEKYAKETADRHIDELRKRGLMPAAAPAPAPGLLP